MDGSKLTKDQGGVKEPDCQIEILESMKGKKDGLQYGWID